MSKNFINLKMCQFDNLKMNSQIFKLANFQINQWRIRESNP